MSSPFDKGVKDGHERLAQQDLELARYVRDIINKSDDTKQVYKLLTNMLQMHESRVLLDQGEGKHPDGRRYTIEDFCTNVGEVRGLRWLDNRIKSMMRKAEKADAEERARNAAPKTP